MIQPPTTGPSVGASTATTPASVVATPCRRSGKSRNTAENTAGISVPPAKPWSTRQATRAPKPEAPAQPAEASVNTPTAATNSQRIVMTRVRKPVSGIAITSAMRYAVWIQLIWSGRIASADWIAGSEVATTWMSRIAMNMPTHIMAKPAQTAGARRSAGTIPSAAVIGATAQARRSPSGCAPRARRR